LCATLVAASVLAASTARADGSVDFIRTRQILVTALLHVRPSEQRDRQMSAVLDRMIAFEEMARASLPDHWKDLSDGQHAEVTALLRRLIQRNYEKSMESVIDDHFEFMSEDLGLEGVMVHVRASSGRTHRTREEIPASLDYLLRSSGPSYKVVDILPRGSSFVQQYKNKLQVILEKEGFDALVKQMKDALAVD
jgi:ABC-type transporter MlaC component